MDKGTIVRSIQGVAPVLSRWTPGLAARFLALLFLTPERHRTPERERAWLQSAVRTTLERSDGVDLPVYTWGSPGPVALLVHGWAGRGSQLGAFVQPLLDQGFQVVAFDAPGHGRAEGRQSSLPVVAQAVADVAAHVGPIHTVVAHSMGTACTSIAVHRGLQVQRLVYLSPPVNPGGFLHRAGAWLGFGPGIADRTQALVERRFAVRFHDAHGETLAPHMDTPLLIVHDRDDTDVALSEAQQLAGLWPDAELVVTEGLGHTYILRAPAVVAQAVAFVAGAPVV